MAIYNSSFTGAEIDDAVQYAQDAITNDAASSLSSSGYQKLNSGLIIQWGQFTHADTGGPVQYTFTLPIAYTTAALQGFISIGNGLDSSVVCSVEGLSTTSISGFTIGSAETRTYRLFCIGY